VAYRGSRISIQNPEWHRTVVNIVKGVQLFCLIPATSLVLLFLKFPDIPGLLPTSILFDKEILTDPSSEWWVIPIGAFINTWYLLAISSCAVLVATIFCINTFAMIFVLEQLLWVEHMYYVQFYIDVFKEAWHGTGVCNTKCCSKIRASEQLILWHRKLFFKTWIKNSNSTAPNLVVNFSWRVFWSSI